MRVSEAAKRLGISPATVRHHIKDGTLPATRIDDPNAWPTGWRYEIDPNVVDQKQGAWIGRGEHRRKWVGTQSSEQTIQVWSPTDDEVKDGRRKRRHAEKVRVSMTTRRRTRNEPLLRWERSALDKVAILAFTGVMLMGHWVIFRRK